MALELQRLRAIRDGADNILIALLDQTTMPAPEAAIEAAAFAAIASRMDVLIERRLAEVLTLSENDRRLALRQ